MRVVHYLPYDDIGGVGFRSASALNRYRPDWTVQAWSGAPSYLQFTQHSEWNWDKIVSAVKRADVLHSHDHRARVGTRKADVVTFHGTGFRESPSTYLQSAGNAKVLVSTLDLWLQEPSVTWMPQMDDLDWLQTFRQPQAQLTVGHFPTNRLLKSTYEFEQACIALQNAGYDFQVIIGEGKSWHDTLVEKGKCDILFDQTQYGYGGNAIEAWAMGIPVISGGEDSLLQEFSSRFGYLPFVEANKATIGEALEKLMDEKNRLTAAQLGRSHAEKFHSYESGAELLASIYEDLQSHK